MGNGESRASTRVRNVVDPRASRWRRGQGRDHLTHGFCDIFGKAGRRRLVLKHLHRFTTQCRLDHAVAEVHPAWPEERAGPHDHPVGVAQDTPLSL